MKSGLKNYQRLKKFSHAAGSKLFGVADVSAIKAEFDFADSVKEKINSAITLGITLSSLALSEIDQQPTKLYFHHYRTANMFLDQLGFVVANWIEDQGFLALPIPASQITDWQSQKAHLSHKKIAVLSGVGWIGRNNLLVSKKFGSQLRLATVLTNMPLKTDKPSKDGCGECFACVKVCPAGAIKDDQKDFEHLVCFEKLKNFQKQNIVGQFICGVCVNACRGRKVDSR
jgi:epoxyqueuosine reductase